MIKAKKEVVVENKCPNQNCDSNKKHKGLSPGWRTKKKGALYECRHCGDQVQIEPLAIIVKLEGHVVEVVKE